MRLHCCYTDSHQELFERWLKPSLPTGFQLHAVYLDQLHTSGDFGEHGYVDCLRRKIQLVVDSLVAAPGEIVVWSDVDILFLDPAAPQDLSGRMEEAGCDVLFQRDVKRHRVANGGFYVCRSNARSLAFFRAVLATLQDHPDMHDQLAINGLLNGGSDLRWDFLPSSYYVRTHGWPPPRRLVLYHANGTFGAGGVHQKMLQLEQIRRVHRHGLPVLLWSCLLLIPGRIYRLAAERYGWLRQTARKIFSARAESV